MNFRNETNYRLKFSGFYFVFTLQFGNLSWWKKKIILLHWSSSIELSWNEKERKIWILRFELFLKNINNLLEMIRNKSFQDSSSVFIWEDFDRLFEDCPELNFENVSFIDWKIILMKELVISLIMNQNHQSLCSE